MKAKVDNVDFRDKSFFEDLKDKNQKQMIENFMFHLAICHTIIIDKKYSIKSIFLEMGK
jgi:hypothetical protein